MMSAAEARLDADIRPAITVLRSKSSYPQRRRPPTDSTSGAAASGGRGSLLSLAAGASKPGGTGDAQPDLGPAVATAPAPAAAPLGLGAARIVPGGPLPGRPVPGRPVPGRPAPVSGRPAPVSGRPVSGRPAPAPGRLTPSPGPIRLTRRGRIVVVALAVIVAAAAASLVWLAVAGQAQASNRAPSRQTSGQGMTRVVVQPGQTLWSIATRAEPAADPRAVVQQIIDANSLTGPAIQAGQVLWVPRG